MSISHSVIRPEDARDADWLNDLVSPFNGATVASENLAVGGLDRYRVGEAVTEVVVDEEAAGHTALSTTGAWTTLLVTGSTVGFDAGDVLLVRVTGQMLDASGGAGLGFGGDFALRVRAGAATGLEFDFVGVFSDSKGVGEGFAFTAVLQFASAVTASVRLEYYSTTGTCDLTDVRMVGRVHKKAA